jgi:hypothetical protein
MIMSLITIMAASIATRGESERVMQSIRRESGISLKRNSEGWL